MNPTEVSYPCCAASASCEINFQKRICDIYDRSIDYGSHISGDAGLAFLAFGLNMVDCGNLLGRKLTFSVSKAAQTKVFVESHSVEKTYTL